MKKIVVIMAILMAVFPVFTISCSEANTIPFSKSQMQTMENMQALGSEFKENVKKIQDIHSFTFENLTAGKSFIDVKVIENHQSIGQKYATYIRTEILNTNLQNDLSVAERLGFLIITPIIIGVITVPILILGALSCKRYNKYKMN